MRSVMCPVDIQVPVLPPSQVSVPEHIVKAVNGSKCILFLGAMASAPSPPGSRFQYKEGQGPPGGGELSKRLAKRCKYPSDDTWNLARVSLYFENREDLSRQLLVSAIAEEVGANTLIPSPALRMLAALPFPIVVTTNYDHLFDLALRETKLANGKRRDPIVRIYDPQRNGPPDDVPLQPTPDRPILLKLHGDIDKPESIVITEEDYIVFIQKMTDEHLHPIHKKIRMYMMEWPMLFIGYSLKDYNLRLLFRTLRWNVDSALFPLSFSVDPRPDNLIVSVWQRGEKKIVNFIQQDLWEFVPALFRQCTGADYQSRV
jgi:hypothetical protein